MNVKAVCFIGHRNVKLKDDKVEKLKSIIENLIIKNNVQIFLFGSRSDFDYICHSIVTELKSKYSFIQRRCYTCRSESCILESEREHWENIYSSFHKREVHLLGVEEEVEFKNKWTAGKASYVERNQAMINDSDICIFIMMKIISHKNTNILNDISLLISQNLVLPLHIIILNRKRKK